MTKNLVGKNDVQVTLSITPVRTWRNLNTGIYLRYLFYRIYIPKLQGKPECLAIKLFTVCEAYIFAV